MFWKNKTYHIKDLLHILSKDKTLIFIESQSHKDLQKFINYYENEKDKLNYLLNSNKSVKKYFWTEDVSSVRDFECKIKKDQSHAFVFFEEKIKNEYINYEDRFHGGDYPFSDKDQSYFKDYIFRKFKTNTCFDAFLEFVQYFSTNSYKQDFLDSIFFISNKEPAVFLNIFKKENIFYIKIKNNSITLYSSLEKKEFTYN